MTPRATLPAVLAMLVACGSSSDDLSTQSGSLTDYQTATVPVGTIPVSVGVNRSGQATASIPISVPPGRLGMAPELTLEYSSASPAGMLGIGFSLSGVPYIERCDLDEIHPDRAVEGMLDWCLGGERLLADGEDGSRARLRATPGTKLERVAGRDGGSGGWSAHYADGRIATFGAAHGGRFYLTAIEDVHGNRVEYDYQPVMHDGVIAALLPEEILYTVNLQSAPDPAQGDPDPGSRRVRFDYELLPNPEQYTAHTRHGSHRVDRRLTSIETAVLVAGTWTVATTYQLAYTNASTTGRSLLETVTRCDRDGVCLPPVTFDWELGDYGYALVGLDEAAVADAPSRHRLKYSVAADFDRDGRDEIAYVDDVYAQTSLHAWKIWDPEEGTLNTEAASRVVFEPAAAFELAGVLIDPAPDVGHRNAALSPRVTDINGDSFPDIVSPYCDLPSGNGCLDDAVADIDYPYANQIAFVLGGSAGLLYDDPEAPGAGTVTLDVTEFRGGERIFITEVGEIDGDGHPDLYVCAGNHAGEAWWSLALNRIHEPGSDFRVVPTYRRCFAWELYQVFDSNGNGLDELHVTLSPTGTNALNACKLKDECEDGWFRASQFYYALEFPRIAADQTPISVEDAIALVAPDDFETAKTQLAPDTAWPTEAYGAFSWPSLPLDLPARVLNGCWNPSELEVLTEIKHVPAMFDSDSGTSQVPAEAFLVLDTFLETIPFHAVDGVPLEELFPLGGEAGHSRHFAPFSTAGPSPDMKVDLNGDGLVDVVRLLPAEVGGAGDLLTEGFRAGTAVYEVYEWGGISPAICNADQTFDYVYGYYMNQGDGSFALEGTSPVLIHDELPYIAANVLAQTIVGDVNGDDRPDLTVPDYAAYLADPQRVASWNTHVMRPAVGHHVTMTAVFDIPYDLGTEPYEGGALPPDVGDIYQGPIWYTSALDVSRVARHLPGQLGGIGYAIEDIEDIASHQAISGAVHLNDKLLDDIVVFNPSNTLGLQLAAFEKLGHEPDYLVRVTDGLGHVAGEFEYGLSRVLDGPTTAPNDQPGQFAKAAPARLVTRVTMDAGLADPDAIRWITFEYHDGRADRMGGILGFGSITRRHFATGEGSAYRIEREEYGQRLVYDPALRAYPFAGTVTDSISEQRATLAAGQEVRLTRWSHAEPAVVPADHPGIIGVYPSTSVSSSYETPATHCADDICLPDELSDTYLLARSESEVLDIDAYGNVLASENTSLDGTVIATSREVTNVTDRKQLWRIGLADSETVTHTAPNGDVRTVHTDFTWSYATGDRTSATRYGLPLDDFDTYLRVELAQDWRGNPIARHERDFANVTSGGDGGDVRSTFTEWEPLGYFASATKNADGWGVTRLHDPFFGTTISTKGPASLAQAQTCIDGLGRVTCSRTRMGLNGPSIGGDLSYVLEPETAYNGAYRQVTLRDGSEIGRVVFDRMSRQTARIYPVLNQLAVDPVPDQYEVLTIYNSRGLVASGSVPVPAGEAPDDADWNNHHYDDAGRRVTTVLSGNRGAVQRSYLGRTVHITDPDGRQTTRRRSPGGHIVYTEDGKGYGTCYFYGALGNIARVSRNCENGNGILDDDFAYTGELDTTFTYDRIGRVVTVTAPESGTSTTSYNAFGQVRQVQDALGDVTEYDYDPLGRIEARTGDDYAATWIYDTGPNAIGKLSASHIEYADGTSVHKTYDFDTWGRPQSTTLETLGEVMHRAVTYDGDNLLERTDYLTVHNGPDGTPGFAVRYAYSPEGFLVTVGDDADPDRFFREIHADGWGNLMLGHYGDGTERHGSWNPQTGHVEFVRSTNATMSPSLVMGWSYAWTPDGDLHYRHDEVDNAAECFAYDAAHQLTGVSAPIGDAGCYGGMMPVLAVGYDAYGRITSKSDVGEGSPYNYDEATGLLMSAGPDTLSFDDKGQLSMRWNGEGSLTPQWYGFGKLEQLDGAGRTVRIYYDADGVQAARLELLAGQETPDRTTLYLGGHTRIVEPTGTEERIAIAASPGAIAEVSITAGQGPAQPGVQSVSFLHTDAHGSPTAVVTDGVVSQRRFDPYGRRTDLAYAPPSGVRADDVTVGFTGHESETVFDLINMRARYFDPTLATFVQADSAIPDPMRGIDWNRYAYVRNNPFRYTDPTGHAPQGDSGGDDGPSGDVGGDDGNPKSETDGSCETLSRAMGMSGECGSKWVFDDSDWSAEHRAPVGTGNLGNTGGDRNSAGGQDTEESSDKAPVSRTVTYILIGGSLVPLPPVLALADVPGETPREADIAYMRSHISPQCGGDPSQCTETELALIQKLRDDYGVGPVDPSVVHARVKRAAAIHKMKDWATSRVQGGGWLWIDPSAAPVRLHVVTDRDSVNYGWLVMRFGYTLKGVRLAGDMRVRDMKNYQHYESAEAGYQDWKPWFDEAFGLLPEPPDMPPMADYSPK